MVHCQHVLGTVKLEHVTSMMIHLITVDSSRTNNLVSTSQYNDVPTQFEILN